MFEGPIIRQPVGDTIRGGLRPLDWNELVARLAAARDLRSLTVRPVIGPASFAARSGAGLAEPAAQRGVNPDGLACGKWSDDMRAGAVHGVGGDRE